MPAKSQAAKLCTFLSYFTHTAQIVAADIGEMLEACNWDLLPKQASQLATVNNSLQNLDRLSLSLSLDRRGASLKFCKQRLVLQLGPQKFVGPDT